MRIVVWMANERRATNLSLPARVKRLAVERCEQTGESLTGYVARLIREDGERHGMKVEDARFDAPKEKSK